MTANVRLQLEPGKPVGNGRQFLSVELAGVTRIKPDFHGSKAAGAHGQDRQEKPNHFTPKSCGMTFSSTSSINSSMARRQDAMQMCASFSDSSRFITGHNPKSTESNTKSYFLPVLDFVTIGKSTFRAVFSVFCLCLAMLSPWSENENA